MKNIKKPPLTLVAITLFLSGLYLFVFSNHRFFEFARLKSIDFVFEMRARCSPPLKHLKELVIIGVDDDSCYKINRAWPWGRDVHAIFLERLAALNPKVVALDFSFIGKSQNPKVDEWFTESLRKHENIILAAYFSPDGLYITPLDIFSQAVKSYGFVDKLIDTDSVSRRILEVVTLDANQGSAYSFGVHTAYAYMGSSPSGNLEVKNQRLLFSYPGEQGIGAEKMEVPIDKRGRMWLPYRYAYKDFAYIPYWKIVMNKVPRRELEGKIALVGPVSDRFHDVHPTPIGRMPGIGLTANEILAILDRDFVHEAFGGDAWFAWMGLALLVTFVFYFLNPLRRLLAFVVCEVLVYGVVLLSLIFQHAIVEPLSPMLVIAIAYVSSLFYEGLAVFLENKLFGKLVGVDGLTGLGNASYFTFQLRKAFQTHRKTAEEFCVAYLDVDGLKDINKKYGHESGNAVLMRLAEILKGGLRSWDLAARRHEDEFVLLADKTGEEGGVQCLKRIKSSLEGHVFESSAGNFQVTLSAGICSNRHPEIRSAGDLSQQAAHALGQAKREGKNRIVVAAPAA